MALFNKYRPNSFSDVCGNKTLISTLIYTLQQDSKPQVYLFTGSRGTGKTTTARLVAKALNCENFNKLNDVCNECNSCIQFKNINSLGLVELDAASNRGIEDIKLLKESAAYLPTGSKWKVYIIDEVHMLSKDAFNSLLKIFEEPPAHVVFIMATTELHKVPITILSRSQRYSFKLASEEELGAKLDKIIKAENVTVDKPKELFELIYNSTQGSYRDAESLLEKLINQSKGQIKLASAETELGALPMAQTRHLYDLVTSKQVKEVIDLLAEFDTYNVNFDNLASLLIDYVKLELKNGLNIKLVSLFAYLVKFQIEAKEVQDEANLFTLNLLEFMSKNN